uniref:Uncharacterized protein n=1 Tax=Suricata suricatta TaxID=37032 RepID=A0A673V1Y4_SURSU
GSPLNPTWLLGLPPLRALPRPTIWAEPASVVPWGQPVTIGCGGPAEAEIFHLEKEGRPSYQGMRNHLHGTEARFPIGAAGEDTAGLYHCAYYQGFTWSESSDTLELMVTGKEASAAPPAVPPAPGSPLAAAPSAPRLPGRLPPPAWPSGSLCLCTRDPLPSHPA